MPIASYRELGVLRRLSTTPVPPSWLLAAQGVVQLCIALATLLIIFVTSVAAFGAPAPKSPAGLILSVAVSVAGLFPIGLMIAGPHFTEGKVLALAYAYQQATNWHKRQPPLTPDTVVPPIIEGKPEDAKSPSKSNENEK